MYADSPRVGSDQTPSRECRINRLLLELEGQLDGDEEDIILAAKAVLEQDEIDSQRFSLRADKPVEDDSMSSINSDSVVDSITDVFHWAGDNIALLDETVASWI